MFAMAEQKGSLFRQADEKLLTYDMLILLTFG
jgi:hypothetical protein